MSFLIQRNNLNTHSVKKFQKCWSLFKNSNLNNNFNLNSYVNIKKYSSYEELSESDKKWISKDFTELNFLAGHSEPESVIKNSKSFDNETYEKIKHITAQFNAPIRHAFAYGSGIFKQNVSNNGGVKPQIDLIFVVTWADHFHSLNMKQYPEHYSFLKYFGSDAVSFVQRKLGASVYYNTFVEMNDLVLKYGVITVDDLIDDLTEWNTLYVSGRMQKPVCILKSDDSIEIAQKANLLSTIRTALLLLPKNFTVYELFKKITSLSYTGDIRFLKGLGENSNKIDNIVSKQLPLFASVYNELISNLPIVTFKSTSDKNLNALENPQNILEQDLNPIKRANTIKRLPRNLRRSLQKLYGEKYGTKPPPLPKDYPQSGEEESFMRRDAGEFEFRVASDTDLTKNIQQSIHDIVNKSSRSQALKGILTAGFIKSFRYAREKREKAKLSKISKKTNPIKSEEEDKSGNKKI